MRPPTAWNQYLGLSNIQSPLKKTDIFAKTAKLLITVVITASDPTGLTAAGATLDAYLHIFDQHSQNNPDLKKLQKEFAKTLKARFEDRNFHCPKGADVLLPQMVEAAVVAHDDFTAANLDPDKIIELLIGRLTDSEHKAPDMLAAFRKLYSPAMSFLLSDPRLISAIQPAIQRKQLEQGDRIEAKLDNAAMLPRDQLELLASRFKHPGPHDASDADLVTYLGNMATQYRSLITRVQQLEQKYPQLGNVAAMALELLQNGDTSAVHKMIRDARDLLRDAHLLEGLEQDAELVQVDAQALIFDGEIQQAYDILTAAADSFASIDRLEPSRRRGTYGILLYDYGLRFAGNALELAVLMWRKAITDVDRNDDSYLWAMLQTNLGNGLSNLGQRKTGSPWLEQAIEAFSYALSECAQDRFPLEWSMLQNNIGNALLSLGERENDTTRLEQAVQAYQKALTEWTQDRVPLDWALTQNNLGAALRTLGEHKIGTVLLEQAVEAHSNALTEYTQDSVPLDWAMTQGNLGGVYLVYFDKTDDPAHLETAETHVQAALAVFEQSAPHYAGMAQNLLQQIAERRVLR